VQDLHLLYLVTPLFHNVNPDFHRLVKMGTSPAMRKLFDRIGLDAPVLERYADQRPSSV
jgi:hypothetical protein